MARGQPCHRDTGDDCAHFISSCIGNESTTPTGGGLNIPTRVPPTYGEPGAQRLIDTVLLGEGLATEVTSLSSLEPGDVVGWDWGDGTIDHDTLYLGNDQLAAHSNSHLAVPMAYYDGTGDTYYLIHINDSTQAPEPGTIVLLVAGAITGFTICRRKG